MRTAIDVLTWHVREAEIMLDHARKKLGHAKSALAAVKNPKRFAEPLVCSGCEKELWSELEFWSHFHVIDPHYPRLGECPIKLSRDLIGKESR
jgi:hypothetical protein